MSAPIILTTFWNSELSNSLGLLTGNVRHCLWQLLQIWRYLRINVDKTTLWWWWSFTRSRYQLWVPALRFRCFESVETGLKLRTFVRIFCVKNRNSKGEIYTQHFCTLLFRVFCYKNHLLPLSIVYVITEGSGRSNNGLRDRVQNSTRVRRCKQ